MGRSVGRRSVGPLLHRAQSARSLLLGRKLRRQVVGPEIPGRQFGAAVDADRSQRSWADDASHRRLPPEGRRDRHRHRDHGAHPRERPRRRLRRAQHQDRRAGIGAQQSRGDDHRRFQFEPRHGAGIQSDARERSNPGRLRPQFDRQRPQDGPAGRRLSHAHGPHLVLRVRHARLPRPRATARPRVPAGAGQHLGQPAGPPLSQ